MLAIILRSILIFVWIQNDNTGGDKKTLFKEIFQIYKESFVFNFTGNTPTEKEGGCMESKLIQEIRSEQLMNRLLKQIECQLENPIECSKKANFRCAHCVYNVGEVEPICSKIQ